MDARTSEQPGKRILLWSVDRRLPWWVLVFGAVLLAGIVIEAVWQS
ncbi:MAG: hypothetical protein WCV67_02945 [Victivallaceae bacterium]